MPVGYSGIDAWAPDHIRVAGRFVAYGQIEGGRYPFQALVLHVAVLDTVRRRERTFLNFSGHVRDVPGVSQMALHGVRLKRNGSLAFLVGPVGEELLNEVWVADARGSRAVASGADVDPDSFRASRRRVSWTATGARRSAGFR